jgi:hypothetical protein
VEALVKWGGQDESIKHHFITCPFAKIIWCIVYMTFNITPPSNIINMFINWLNGVAKKDEGHIKVGVCTLLWAIWNVPNDVIFNKKKFLIIFAGYSHDYLLNPYVVLSPAHEEVSDHGYLMQPLATTSTGFLQLVQLTYC